MLNFSLYPHMDLTNLSVLTLPAGLSLLLFERSLEKDKELRALCRFTGLATLVAGGLYENFQTQSALAGLIVVALSVSMVLSGIAWRIKSYLYAGFGFLILTIVVNLARWAIADRLVAGVIGVSAGIAFFAFGLALVRHRDQLLKQYGRVRAWDW